MLIKDILVARTSGHLPSRLGSLSVTGYLSKVDEVEI